MPYDLDGDYTTFSDEEQTRIQRIWARVAEDYAPFDVDVTTEQPATFTRYTARARHWTDEDAKRHREMGFEPGWGACADQLKALCEEVTAEA